MITEEIKLVLRDRVLQELRHQHDTMAATASNDIGFIPYRFASRYHSIVSSLNTLVNDINRFTEKQS